MKTYKVTVTEVHTATRVYYVNAENKVNARLYAKNTDYIDAEPADWSGGYKVKSVNSIAEHDVDLTDF